MIITATQKNSRQTALKVRLVANQVRKLSLVDAMEQLSVIEKKASLVILKLIRQAVANATHNHGYAVSDLRLKNIIVTPGPTYRRFRAVSRGRAHTVFKRTCHVTVEIEAGVAPKAEAKKTAPKATETKVAPKAQETETKSAAKKTTKKAAPKKTAKKSTKKAEK